MDSLRKSTDFLEVTNGFLEDTNGFKQGRDLVRLPQNINKFLREMNCVLEKSISGRIW